MPAASLCLPVRLALAFAVVLVALPVWAQGLQIRAAVTPDAQGDTAGMTRQSVATAPEREVWVGPVVLDLPPASILTVGLELDAGGQTALSLWLSNEAGQAFAVLTAASIGQALAVMYDGEVLTAPIVQSAIPNGLVRITGLGEAEARRLADALREATAPLETSLPVVAPAAPPPRMPRAPLDVRPPPRPNLSPVPPRAPAAEVLAPLPSSETNGPAGEAQIAAQAFVAAVATRDWRTVATMLHPDALTVARTSALAILTLDGATVIVRSETREGSFIAADALGADPRASRASDLSDRDLATLYLAALDVLGVWGPPGVPRSVVGEIHDGDRVHVLMRAAALAPGVSDVTLITLAQDGGEWRPLLTQPQGF